MAGEINKTQALPLFDHFLRDYQREAHAKIRQSYRSGKKRVLIEMPTGCGKTRTFVLLPRPGARTLVIVPLVELIGQTVKTIRSLRDCEADIEQRDLWAVPESEFVVGSWQTLMKNDRYKRFVGKVDLVIVDEAHWGFTTAARDLLNEFVDGGARVLGCTATAYRADKQALCGFYEEVAYCLALRKAIDDGWLVPPRVKVHYVKSIDLNGLARKAGADFAPEELDQILRSEEALQDLASLIKKHHVPGRKGIVFAHSVAQARLLRDLLLDRHGLHCSQVDSYMADEDYKTEIEAFTKGDRELVINVGILTTGWDYPPLAECFLAKPTKALNKYTQMLGRCTRTLDGVLEGHDTPEARKEAIAASAKPHFVVHDITDSSRCHKLCSALDVLSDQNMELKAKVKAKTEDKEVSLEEIDQAVAAEIEAEREAKRLQREAERKRRSRLVLGVEWASEDRDPFSSPDRDAPSRRCWRFPFGRHKGQPIRSIEKSYLQWALREARLNPLWRRIVTDELKRRDNPQSPHDDFRSQLDEGRRYAAEMAAMDREAASRAARDE